MNILLNAYIINHLYLQVLITNIKYIIVILEEKEEREEEVEGGEGEEREEEVEGGEGEEEG